MENIKWIETKSKIKSFRLGEEPELIHIIKTGFHDRYMVVQEDAYELNLGDVSFGTQLEIEEKYGIFL